MKIDRNAGPGETYICVDCSGWPLQFTIRGRSVKCDENQADRFSSRAKAQAALARAGERGGMVTCVESPT